MRPSVARRTAARYDRDLAGQAGVVPHALAVHSRKRRLTDLWMARAADVPTASLHR